MALPSRLTNALATLLASYVLIGVDEIGVELSHPFPFLPLQQLATAVQRDVGAAIAPVIPRPAMPPAVLTGLAQEVEEHTPVAVSRAPAAPAPTVVAA